jgi:PAS domain S-box-containing protein
MSKDIVRVLLVEDSPSDARLLRESLEDYPLQRFAVEQAERLGEAVALLARDSFDVVLLDLNLLDSSGLETCRRLARVAGQVPIIVLTGADDEAIATEAMRLGVQDYLVKGQAYGSVIGRTIRYAVERSQSQQCLREVNARLQEQAEELQSRTEELRTQAEELRRQAGELATVNATLRQSEERLHLAMESGRVGIWEWEVGTERVEWSQGIYALLGYTPGAVTPSHQGLRRRIHPEDLARHDQALRESMERCEDYACQFRVVWADGSVHWVEARGQYAYVNEENGILLRMRGVLSDIDQRRQAEEALRQSEERHRRLIENLKGNHFVYLHDTNGIFQYLSESLTDVLGYAPAEFMTHYDRYLTDHPVNQEVRRHTELSIQGIRQPPYEVNIRHKDGSTRWLEVQEVPVFDAEGKVIAVEGVAQDITGRKEVEDALRQSERQFRSTFENAAIGIAHVALDGHIRQFNSRFCEIAGDLPEDIVGKTCEQITFADDWKAERVQMQRLLDGEVAHYSLEKRYVRADGNPVWVNLTRSIQRDHAGTPEYFIVLVEDISDRKQAEEALRELTATLESKVAQRTAELLHRTRQLQKLTLELSETEDRERQRMAEILHDDLQQMLAAAKFHVGLLRNRVKRDSSLEATAGQIDRMLKDAIEKSRSLSHELSPAVMHHGDLAETLRWLANQVQAKHGLAVHVHAQDPVRLPSEALKGFLYKAAQELLFNVVKHARVKEAGIRVRQYGRGIGLSVSDRGRGFDPQELRDAAGFGLLNIRARVESLGGRMTIRSVKGKGSKFVIVVPVGRQIADTVGAGPRACPPLDNEGRKEGDHRGSPLRVLLADDHEIVRQGLASLLSEERTVEVVGEATNGREAVNLADQLRPDVVIMDVSMPVMSGDEATRQIKKDRPKTRIIALSMWEESDVREKMYRAGAESYVLKTAPSEELLAAIRGLKPDAEPPASSRSF